MDRVRESYDRVARRYAEEIGDELAGKPVDRALYGLFAELVRTAVPESGDPPVVGDVGCGPGHVTAYLSGLGLRPVGVDLSPEMIRVARERYPSIEFSVGAFPDGSASGQPVWAGAVAAYSVIHLDDRQRQAAWRGLAG